MRGKWRAEAVRRVMARAMAQHSAGPEVAERELQAQEARITRRQRHGRLLLYTSAALGASAACLRAYERSAKPSLAGEREHLTNWSATHECTTPALLQPDTPEEAQRMLAESHRLRSPLRICGNMLSPNGCSLSNNTMLSMANCDRIKRVDTSANQVTVEAGATCNDVLKELKKYGLTLQNFSSVYEQQLGGWVQVRSFLAPDCFFAFRSVAVLIISGIVQLFPGRRPWNWRSTTSC